MASSSILLVNANSGIAGDMFSAALLDLLMATNQEELFSKWKAQIIEFAQSLPHPITVIPRIMETKRNGLRGKLLSFPVETSSHSRRYGDIVAQIEKARLQAQAKRLALAVLACLAAAEAHVHDNPIDQVHLHEAGSEDSILDIVSAALLITLMDRPTLLLATLAVAGRGEVTFSHGTLPLPAPATLHLLQGYELTYTDETKELVTPTGAAIVRGLGLEQRKLDERQFKVEGVGYGAGIRELPNRPNLLRITLLKDEKATMKIKK